MTFRPINKGYSGVSETIFIYSKQWKPIHCCYVLGKAQLKINTGLTDVHDLDI